MKIAPFVLALSLIGIAIPDSWRHNPRERIEAARAAWDRGELAAAAALAEEALALDPEDPRALYDAGTAHLAAGDVAAALPQLEAAAKGIAGEEAAAAFYNLGNALLAAGQADSAIAAFEESLRRDPTRRDAKQNLELALRQRDQQQQEQQEQDTGQEGDERDAGAGGSTSDGGTPPPGARPAAPSPAPTPRPGAGAEREAPPPPGSPGSSAEEGRRPPRSSRLPGFAEQPDMTADQAAAILEAVENLEREQRRRIAEELRRRRESAGRETKDW